MRELKNYLHELPFGINCTKVHCNSNHGAKQEIMATPIHDALRHQFIYCAKAVGFAMILLKQMIFVRCTNDVLLAQNDVRTRANLGMARIIEKLLVLQ